MNDSKYNYLRSLGFSGALNDITAAFYRYVGAIGSSLQDLETSMFDTMGVERGSLQDRWNTFLSRVGFSGDNEKAWGDGITDGKLLQEQAIGAIRRNGGSAWWVPDDLGLTLGSNLVTNGTFDSGITTGWSSVNGSVLSVVSGRLRVTSSGVVDNYARQDVPTVSGRTYLVTAAVTGGTSTGRSLVTFNFSVFGYVAPGGSGSVSFLFTATGSTSPIFCGLADAGGGTNGVYTEFDNISVREVLSSQLYTDSTGTTPVSAVGDVLGMVTDRSYGSGNFGTERVTDSWTCFGSASYSAATKTVTFAALTDSAQQTGVFVSGKTYRFEYTPTAAASAGAYVSFFVGQGTQFITTHNSADLSRKSVVFTANSTDKLLVVYQGTGHIGSFVNISVREIYGNHATQSTTANKPGIARVPRKTQGPTNLLVYSNDLSNVAWGKVNSPAVTATTITRTTTAATYVNQGGAAKAAAALPYSIAAVASQGAGRYFAARIQGTYPSRLDAVFDLQTGTVSSSTVVGAFTTPAASMVDLGSGKYLCCASAISDTATSIGPLISVNSNAVQVDGTDSSATSSGNVFGVGLFAGTFTAQQIIATGGIPPTTNQALPNVLEWSNAMSFDGTNDALTLPVLWNGSSDHTVIVSTTPAATGGNNKTLFSCNDNSVTTTSFYPAVGVLGSTGVARFVWRNTAGTNADVFGPSSIVGIPSVLTAKKSGTSLTAYVNGVSVGTNTATGTYSVTESNIGVTRWNNVLTDYFNSSGSFICAVPAAISDADRKAIERFAAYLSGATYAG